MSGIQILNNMFGYNTPIPDAPVTRSFRIGVYSSGYRRTDKDEERVAQKKIKPVKDPNALKPSERRILQIVRCNNGITGTDLAKKTKWTQNHCSILLTTLFKRGLIRRVQRTAPNVRFYEYFKSDSA